MKIVLFLCALLLISCSQTSHIPAPWQLPGAVLGSTLDNAVYGSRRNKVKHFIQENYSQLKNDVYDGQGDVLTKLFVIAKANKKQEELLDELQNTQSAYFVRDELTEEGLEKLTVTVMVHSD